MASTLDGQGSQPYFRAAADSCVFRPFRSRLRHREVRSTPYDRADTKTSLSCSRFAPRMRFTRRRLIAGFTTMAAAAGGLAGVRAAQARYYDGPLSDHFDGMRFVDPHGMAPKSIPDLVR